METLSSRSIYCPKCVLFRPHIVSLMLTQPKLLIRAKCKCRSQRTRFVSEKFWESLKKEEQPHYTI